ncbi:MAG: DUF1684 domain-containing protein [Microscillaceae bacterium]|nr:DUF1684 domain-containing protein [Microscillaceae bacterium]
MRRNHLLAFLLLIGLLLIFFYNFLGGASGAETEVQHQLRIQKERKAKDNFLKNDAQSPLLPGQKAAFEGLAYFPPAFAYRVQARLQKLSPPENISLPMSKGQPETYLRFAKAYFKAKGQSFVLTLLRKTGQDPRLFLVFSDQTSGQSTYGGGRYLDIPYQEGQKQIFLDFNQAYNPYCAYNAAYACPLPLPENHLEMKVEAGEMAFHP